MEGVGLGMILNLTDHHRTHPGCAVGDAKRGGGESDIVVHPGADGMTSDGHPILAGTEGKARDIPGEFPSAVGREEVNLIALSRERKAIGGLIKITFAKHKVVVRRDAGAGRYFELLRVRKVIGEEPSTDFRCHFFGIVELDHIGCTRGVVA